SCCILNEISHITKEEFAKNLLDNASKVPHGLVVCITNAGFISSWQESLRDVARTSPRWYFSAYTQQAPWLDAAEIEEAKKRNSATRFARLWEGQWVHESADAIRPSDIDNAVTLDGATLAPKKGWSAVAGVDIGIRRDHSSVVLLGRHRKTE